MSDLVPSVALTGAIRPSIVLNGSLTAECAISGTVCAAKTADSAPVYDGDYVITPQLEQEATLSTKGKKLTEDVVVLKIPRYEVTNDAGGITLILGGD